MTHSLLTSSSSIDSWIATICHVDAPTNVKLYIFYTPRNIGSQI